MLLIKAKIGVKQYTYIHTHLFLREQIHNKDRYLILLPVNLKNTEQAI